MENNTKDTFISLKWDRYSLIVIRNNCFKDLTTNACCHPKDIELLELRNELWKQCLEELRRNKCEYIIAWYNDQEVMINNKTNRVHTFDNEKFMAWYTYRIKRPNNHVVAAVENMTRKYYRITVMPRRSLYDLIVEANNTWYISESELVIKKRSIKQYNKWGGLNKDQKIIMKQLRMYTRRVAEIWDKDEWNIYDENELAMYRQKFNIKKAIKINKILKSWDKEKIDKIISLVKTAKTYHEVINNFS